MSRLEVLNDREPAPEAAENLFDALVEAAAERVAEMLGRRRWAEIEGAAEYFGVPVRRIREWRERGMPARLIGRRLLFDLRACEAWIEGRV